MHPNVYEFIDEKGVKHEVVGFYSDLVKRVHERVTALLCNEDVSFVIERIPPGVTHSKQKTPIIRIAEVRFSTHSPPEPQQKLNT